MPMLSTMLLIACGGMIERTLLSIWSMSLAVSSMRVPVGARTCIRICADWTGGEEVLAEIGHEPERDDHR